MSADADRNVVRAAALLLLDASLRLIEDDPHDWSERPCPTCRPISAMVGRPFGCYSYALRKQAERQKPPDP